MTMEQVQLFPFALIPLYGLGIVDSTDLDKRNSFYFCFRK